MSPEKRMMILHSLQAEVERLSRESADRATSRERRDEIHRELERLHLEVIDQGEEAFQDNMALFTEMRAMLEPKQPPR